MSSFIETFLIVFFAEMGDKSQFLALAFASKYKLSKVILGIALGIGLNHGLAIILGSLIGSFMDLNVIKFLAAILFLVFGLLSLVFEYGEEEEEDQRFQKLGPVLLIAGTFFLGELGDKTQIIAMTMGAVSDNKLLTFLATWSSMMVVSLIGILVARVLKKQLPEMTMNLIAAGLFIFFGLRGLWEGFEYFAIAKIYTILVIGLLALGIFLVVKKNQKSKDAYYIDEITRNLNNCIGCTEETCNCQTRDNIERLTREYLGGDLAYVGSVIKYIEGLKKMSPKGYYRLYQTIVDSNYMDKIKDR
ncbi:MAG: TMEM165/GDT1 family protein [Bacillota bacterium]|nr:TMEM165/GDT1 family protein [Bacillota bacterium]